MRGCSCGKLSASMRHQLAVALLFFLYSFLTVGNYGFAQNRQDYIITHEPSVNVRPCPRFTEECNAIYRLPTGTIIRDGVTVQGDQYASSDEWIRFIRNGELAYIHSSLVRLAPPNSDLADVERAHAWVALYNDYSGYSGNAEASIQIFWRVGARKVHVYVGGAECYNRVRIFEDEITELECSIFGEVWILRNINRIHLIIEGENYDDPETELRCGRHNDSTDEQLLFACVLEGFQPTPTPTERPTRTPIPTRRPTSTLRPTRTPQPTSIAQCDHLSFPINGTMESRRNIFERWLDCQYDLSRGTFENLNDEERMFDIWWIFVEFACGYATYPEYWIIDTEWRCKQLTHDQKELNAPPCGPVQLTGSTFTRERIFNRWLECAFGIDSGQFFELHATIRGPIGYSFMLTACGEDDFTFYWNIDESWSCERRSNRTGEILPTFTPTQTPRPTQTPSPTLISSFSASRQCEHITFPINGTVQSRRSIFERWLDCQHSLRVIEFRRLSNEERMFDIWSDFVEFACGFTTGIKLWIIDPEWRCKQLSWNRDDLIAPPCGPVQLIGNEMNRNRVFDRWLDCNFGIRYDEYRRLHITMAEPIARAFVTAACGEETTSYYWQINDNWSCERIDISTGEILPTYTPTRASTHTPSPTRTPRPIRTPLPTQTPICGTEELTGSVENRISIFERWLSCEHDLEYFEFEELSDFRSFDIWLDFAETKCGADTADYYWLLNVDTLVCEQVTWKGFPQCTPLELSENTFNRIVFFDKWLSCKYDMNLSTFYNFLNESRQTQILQEFTLIACGPDTDDYYWYIEEGLVCQKEFKDQVGGRT